MTTSTDSSALEFVRHRGPNPVARTLNRLTSPDNGPGFTLKFHSWLYRTSGGRLGHGLIGAPTLLLGTVGRRSHQRRVTPVVYVHHRGQVVIGATNGGEGRPGWFYNLAADPRVEVQIGRQRLKAAATFIDPAEPDYQLCWHHLDQVTHGRYAAYAARSPQPIALVGLEPRGER